jgi:hypothetical protein
MPTQSIRRSIALSKRLADEVSAVAPPELKRKWSRLVTVALQQYAAEQRRLALERSIADMGADPQIQRETRKILREFADADSDGLRNG